MVDNLIDAFAKTLEMLDSIEFKNKSNGTLRECTEKRIYSQNTVNQILI